MVKLVVISKAQLGLRYELGRHWVTIGRSPVNAFQIADSSISGQHCEVRLRGQELDVRDMRSTNGTFINGTMLTEGVLKAGATLRLGEVELRLEVSNPLPGEFVPFQAEREGTSSKSELAQPGSATNPKSTKRQVLLVDDSMALLETAGELFESFARGEWEIHKACGADQALSRLAEHPIEIAVLDLSMPMLDGVQLLGMIHRRHPEVKKVILTGVPNETNRAYCLANGAELFLEKPATRDGFRFVFNVLNDLINWNQQEGFSGTLQQVGLTDIIQIECLRRSSCILEVHNARDRGDIYIESGVIVHATAGEISGQKALHGLLSLNNGRFHLYPYRQPSERTIQGSWEWLLMESARVRDEEKGSRQEDKTVLITRGTPEVKGDVAVAAQLTKTRSMEPPRESSGAAPIQLPEIGNGLVVVSTYDGKWNPVDGEQQ
jgi:pSer/pThr/pTyr-binding forkhead associated (FHA) protein